VTNKNTGFAHLGGFIQVVSAFVWSLIPSCLGSSMPLSLRKLLPLVFDLIGVCAFAKDVEAIPIGGGFIFFK
ncbi:MAG: hypothetical protein ACI8V2_003078, partial [Candidatus Latescibacterota bacterium]